MVIQSPHNSGTHGFSLNGCLRSQGYVGQTSLSRTLPRSLSGPHYNGLRGYGGAGNLNVMQSAGIVSGLQDYNDNNVVKTSVGNTKSLIRTKYMGLLNRGNEKPQCILLDPLIPTSCGQWVDETSGEHTKKLKVAETANVSRSPEPNTPPIVLDPFLLRITRPTYTNYNAITKSPTCVTQTVHPVGGVGVSYYRSYDEYLDIYRSSCNISKFKKGQINNAPMPSITKPKKDIYA